MNGLTSDGFNISQYSTVQYGMNMYLAIVCIVAVEITRVCAAVSTIDEHDMIIDSQCTDDSDCAIKVDKFPKLTLQCVNKKCKCSYQAGFVPDFLYLEPGNNQCLMSRYGRCGKGLKQPLLEIGCAGGFQCLLDQRCRDPANQDKVHDSIFSFKIDEKTTECNFSSKLQLKLDNKACICKIQSSVPKYPIWNILSYEGDNDCSAGKFGPCGLNADLGIEIGCHGPGVKCVKGTCTDPHHPKSVDGEPCSEMDHCAKGTICNLKIKECITRHSKKKGEKCSVTEQCAEELICYSYIKQCIVRNSVKKWEVCTDVDGKDECEPGHVCTRRRFKSDPGQIYYIGTGPETRPKCVSQQVRDDPEELCDKKCKKGTFCNIITLRCIYENSIFQGGICSITTNTSLLENRVCKQNLKCVPIKNQKNGERICQLSRGSSSISQFFFIVGSFKLNVLIPIILSVVISIVNF